MNLKNFLFTAFINAICVIALKAQVPIYAPTIGLSAWYSFDGNADDVSGGNNHGAVNGATLATGRFGNANTAYLFNGTSNNISLVNPFLGGNQNSSFTFHSLIYTNSTNIIQGIWGKNLSWGEVNFFITSLNGVQFSWANSITGNKYSAINSQANVIQPNIWYDIVVTFENSVGQIYLNGIPITTSLIWVAQGGSVLSTNQIENSCNFQQIASSSKIGVYQNGSNLFNGKIDEFGIWNRALTQCEIQDLYHAQLGSQAISAGLDQSICAGNNVILNAFGGSNYQWNNNVVDGSPFVPTQTASYAVNGTDSLGCTGSDTVVVSVLENGASSLSQTALDSYTLNGQTYTQSGTYTQVIPGANGCDSTITLNLTLNFTGIHDLGTATKILVKITDLNGKTIPRRKNTVMLFIYEDGTVERVVEMED